MKDHHHFAKSVRLIILAVFFATGFARAAEPQIPEQAKAIHARLAPALKPAVREWVSLEAKKVSKNPKLNEAAIKADIQSRFAGQSLAGADVEALAFLVMMEAAQDADKDLKSAITEMKAASEKKAAQREAANKLKREEAGVKAAARQEYTQSANTNLQIRAGTIALKPDARRSAAKQDSLSELGETESLRLQMALDRRTKAIETLSNLLKKMSETQSNIVSNLK